MKVYLVKEKTYSLKSDVESGFIAGRQGSVCEVSPVSCPPTPPSYTQITRRPDLDSACSAAKEPNHHSLEETPIEEQECCGEVNGNLDRPCLMSSTRDEEAHQGMNNDSAKEGSHELRDANCRLPSPPKNENLTFLLERSIDAIREIPKRRRRTSVQDTPLSAIPPLPPYSNPKPGELITGPSLDAESCSCPCRFGCQNRQIWSPETVSEDVSDLLSIRQCLPHSSVQSPNLQTTGAGSVQEVLQKLSGRQNKDDALMLSFEETHPDRDHVSDRKTQFFEDSNRSRNAVGSLSPTLKLTLPDVQRDSCRHQFILNFRKTHISLDEGILSTELEIFFANDNTSPQIPIRKPGRQESNAEIQKTTKTSPMKTSPTAAAAREGLGSDSGGPNNAVMGRSEKSRLNPFCGCLGSSQPDSSEQI